MVVIGPYLLKTHVWNVYQSEKKGSHICGLFIVVVVAIWDPRRRPRPVEYVIVKLVSVVEDVMIGRVRFVRANFASSMNAMNAIKTPYQKIKFIIVMQVLKRNLCVTHVEIIDSN